MDQTAWMTAQSVTQNAVVSILRSVWPGQKCICHRRLLGQNLDVADMMSGKYCFMIHRSSHMTEERRDFFDMISLCVIHLKQARVHMLTLSLSLGFYFSMSASACICMCTV